MNFESIEQRFNAFKIRYIKGVIGFQFFYCSDNQLLVSHKSSKAPKN